MSESMQGPLVNLNISLTGHDATTPVAPPGDVPFNIKGVNAEENKAKTGNNFVVEFSNAVPLTGTNGKPIPIGALVRKKYFPLQPSEKQLADGQTDKWKDGICKLLDAAFGTDDNSRPDLNAETAAALIGKTVLVAVTITDDPQYGQQNELGVIKKLA